MTQMRAFLPTLIAAAALAVTLPAAAGPVVQAAAEGYVLLAKKDDREGGGRGEGRRERGSRGGDEQRSRGYEDRGGGYEDRGGGHERRRITRGEAAQRAKGGGRGRVLGIDESQGESESGYEVRILDGGRLRTIRVPAEDRDD